jgi:hypothetical protein
LPYNSTGQIFVAFEKPEHLPAIGKFCNLLNFTVKEVNVMAHVYDLCQHPTLIMLSCFSNDCSTYDFGICRYSIEIT